MAQEVINDDVRQCLFPNTVLIQCFKLSSQTKLLCNLAAALRLAGSTNRRAEQDRTKIPWAEAGACAWTGVEDPDTMQGCTLLKELEPGDRALDTSERLPDLQ